MIARFRVFPNPAFNPDAPVRAFNLASLPFADPEFPAPPFSVYEERMHEWVGLPNNIEHLA